MFNAFKSSSFFKFSSSVGKSNIANYWLDIGLTTLEITDVLIKKFKKKKKKIKKLLILKFLYKRVKNDIGTLKKVKISA